MQDLVILHGAIGSATQFTLLEQQLSSNFNIHNLDLPGHGGSQSTGVFSIESFAEYVSNYCEQKRLKSVCLFGYSMGGYVAMYLAKNYPGLIHKVATLATK